MCFHCWNVSFKKQQHKKALLDICLLETSRAGAKPRKDDTDVKEMDVVLPAAA